MDYLGAHIECRSSRACGADGTITDVTIKTTDRKWDPGTWMTSCPEAMGWGFGNLKKKNSSLRFDARGRKLIFGARRGQTCSLRRGAACGGVRWKSQHSKKLCLSLLMSKNFKLKKIIKSFIPEPKKRVVSISCFSDSYVYEHLWTFSVTVWICQFHGFVSWSYIFGREYITHAVSKPFYFKQFNLAYVICLYSV